MKIAFTKNERKFIEDSIEVNYFLRRRMWFGKKKPTAKAIQSWKQFMVRFKRLLKLHTVERP